MERIAVVGAGSWGTALAVHFARKGFATSLWGRDADRMRAVRAAGRNQQYLPDTRLPAELEVEANLAKALADRDCIIIAVPSAAYRETLTALQPVLPPMAGVCWATKGFELESGKLPLEITVEMLGARQLAVISGPTFAKEVAAGLPTALTIASSDAAYARHVAHLIAAPSLRAYTQSDVLGVEIGGAVKNVIAIGVGIADGLGFGANARIALITRGLAEMMRLGSALGAVRETFTGLSGLGDLVLTCSDDQSRNRRFGISIGRGERVADAQAAIGQVVEGVRAAQAVNTVARRLNIQMPICSEVYRILYESRPPMDAVRALMTRELRAEGD